MPLDVEVPDPPRLRGGQNPGDYDAVDEVADPSGDQAGRQQLADALEAGAWAEAFDDWRQETFLTEEQYRAALEVGVLEELDFTVNPSAGDVGYRAPSVSADRLQEVSEDFGRSDAQDVEEALDELGRTASEVLENDYLERTGEEFGFFPD